MRKSVSRKFRGSAQTLRTSRWPRGVQRWRALQAQPACASRLSLMYGSLLIMQRLPGRTGPPPPRPCSKDLPGRRKSAKAHEFRSHFEAGRVQEIRTMTVYVIADVKITDDKWVPAYAASVHDIVHKHGGKYLSRSGNVKTLEGKPLDTTLIALLQFPSAEAAEAFARDPEYAPHAKARQSGSDSRFQLIDDTDLAGTIPYLAKG